MNFFIHRIHVTRLPVQRRAIIFGQQIITCYFLLIVVKIQLSVAICRFFQNIETIGEGRSHVQRKLYQTKIARFLVCSLTDNRILTNFQFDRVSQLFPFPDFIFPVLTFLPELSAINIPVKQQFIICKSFHHWSKFQY